MLASCNSAKVDAVSTDAIFGKWKFKSTGDGIISPFDVSMEIKTDKDANGFYTVSGHSSVNFYFAGMTFNASKKTIKFSNIGSTQISGSVAANTFESDFFAYLAKVESYEMKDSNTLQLNMPSDAKAKFLLFERVP